MIMVIIFIMMILSIKLNKYFFPACSRLYFIGSSGIKLFSTFFPFFTPH